MRLIQRLSLIVALAALAVGGVLVSASSADQIVTTPNGTWDAYPGQQATYQTSVQQPINANGSSNWKAKSNAVIPVKFAVSQGYGPFVFQSIFSDNPGNTANDYSFLDFTPGQSITLSDITQLSAMYDFTTGDCAGGSLRWTVYLNDNGVTRNLDIHYQPGENGLSDQFCKAGTSGLNLVDTTSTDPYVVIQEFTYSGSPYTFLSGYNTTYADALSQLGNLPVIGMNLILDSGWGANGNQVVDLTSATVGVGGSNPYTDTFTPQPSGFSPICPTEQANIKVVKVDGTPLGDVNEAASIQPKDENGIFRIVDCKYMYNLATTSLPGVGTYKVYAVINGVTISAPAVFDLK